MGGGVDVSNIAIEKAKAKYHKPVFYSADVLDDSVIDDFEPDCICMVEVTWYILDKLEEFKKIISLKSKGSGFYHTLMTYAPGEQKYGIDYFSNLEEIMHYWSDSIEIFDYGQIGNISDNGGHRTFFYGKIK